MVCPLHPHVVNQGVTPATLPAEGPVAAAAAAAAAAKSLQSSPTLCEPIDSSPPRSPVPGILQARPLDWVAIFLLQCMKVKSESAVAQSCPTLSDPMDRTYSISSKEFLPTVVEIMVI